MKTFLQLTPEEARSATLEIFFQYIGGSARLRKFDELQIAPRRGIAGWIDGFRKAKYERGILKARAAPDYEARHNPPIAFQQAGNNDANAFRLHFTRDGQPVTLGFSGHAELSLVRHRNVSGPVRWPAGQLQQPAP